MKCCQFPNCNRPFKARGLCNGHYRQWQRGGTLTPLHLTNRPDGSPPRIICDESPCPNPRLSGQCHIFRGGRDSLGYGQVRIDGKMVRVHQHIWQTVNGPVPAGLELDHQCRVPPCCNEDHLRAVTHQVNCTENIVGAGWQLEAAKTHCPQGHEYTPTNTYRNPNGHRKCRACRKNKRHRRTAECREAAERLREEAKCCLNDTP